MPPESSAPPLAAIVPEAHTRRRIVIFGAVLLLLVLAAVSALFLFRDESADQGFVIADSNQGVAYVYKNGTLTLATEPATPAPETFAPEGSQPIAIEANTNALTACSSGECMDLFLYGLPAERPVVFDVSGNTLAFISPLTSEFLAYTLHPAAPVRIEPLIVAENTVMPGVSALLKHPTSEHTFVFAESLTTDEGEKLHVCTVSYKEGDTALTRSRCAQTPLTAPLTAPFITLLP